MAMSRPVHIYRLDVLYPEGSRFDPEHPEDRRWDHWEPPGGTWDPGYSADPEYDDRFRWPAERLYLSSSAAKRRAALFEKYGAKVTIERSEPVTWR